MSEYILVTQTLGIIPDTMFLADKDNYTTTIFQDKGAIFQRASLAIKTLRGWKIVLDQKERTHVLWPFYPKRRYQVREAGSLRIIYEIFDQPMEQKIDYQIETFNYGRLEGETVNGVIHDLAGHPHRVIVTKHGEITADGKSVRSFNMLLDLLTNGGKS